MEPARLVHLAAIVRKLHTLPFGMATAFDTPSWPETRKRLVIAVHGTVNHRGWDGRLAWVESYPILCRTLAEIGEELIKEEVWDEEDFSALIREWTFKDMRDDLSDIPCLTNEQAWEILAAMEELVPHHLNCTKINNILNRVKGLQ